MLEGIVHKFRHCSEQVKLKLFKTYCSTFYMSQLWCRYKRASKQRLKVAYNNIFRKLMCLNRETSISRAFVLNDVDGFSSLMRRLSYSFYKRIMYSSNSLICTILSSVYFTFSSTFFREINSLLFMYWNVHFLRFFYLFMIFCFTTLYFYYLWTL